MNENVDYVAKKPSKSTKFLWWCAGADEKILQYCSYSDHIKYLGIGGVVLATTFMAALSMGFALHTIFGVTDPKTGVFEGNWFVTLPISLIWGIIVFNLDRFIVSSTGKGDGESTISLSELGNATPRLLMAILLGLTISAPLETTIFDKEIQREWKGVSDKMAISRQYEVEQKFEKKIMEVNDKLAKNDVLLKTSKEKYDDYALQINELQTGTGRYKGEKCTEGPPCKNHSELYKTRDRAMQDMDTMNTMNLALNNDLKKLQDEKTNEIKSEQNNIESQQPGFLDKIMMLEGLSSHGKEVEKYNAATQKVEMKKDPETGEMVAVKEEIYGSAFWAIWLVRLLFMIIEIAPVILKLMLIKSPYDYMTENVNQILEAKQGISRNHVTDEEGKLTKYKENFNPKRIVAIVEHQNAKEEENAKEAITRFADKEKEEIAKNPDAFIKPDNS
jgi:uncharacterized membrane protein